MTRARWFGTWLVAAAFLIPRGGSADQRGGLVVAVYDEDGHPLPLADVIVKQDDAFVVDGVTDPRGVVLLPGPRGTIRVIASKVGYSSETRAVASPTGDAALAITLTATPEPADRYALEATLPAERDGHGRSQS